MVNIQSVAILFIVIFGMRYHQNIGELVDLHMRSSYYLLFEGGKELL